MQPILLSVTTPAVVKETRGTDDDDASSWARVVLDPHHPGSITRTSRQWLSQYARNSSIYMDWFQDWIQTMGHPGCHSARFAPRLAVACTDVAARPRSASTPHAQYGSSRRKAWRSSQCLRKHIELFRAPR